MELPKIPRELEEAIRKNELLIFVGAGLSYNLINIKKQPLKGWSNLVHQILLHLKEEGHDVEVFIPMIDRFEPIEILRLIERDKHIPREKISDFIKDFLDLDDDNNFDLHRKLYRLSTKIITTNYDCAFEKAVRELEKNTAYKGKNYELTKHKQSGASLLFKLHGCFKDVDSMVLYPSGYEALYQNKERDAEHSILVLRNIIFNKSILFIGAGMGDFQINNLFSEIKSLQGDYNQKHFIITKNALDSSLDFLTPLLVSDFTQIDGIVDQLIVIKEQSSSNDTEQIKTLKAQLAASEEKIKELAAISHPDRDKLLEREAWKYFSRGVNFSLAGDSESAAKEYEVAVELKPDLHEAWNNWGTDLGNLARKEVGKEVTDLYFLAFNKYQKAIEFKQNYYEAYFNWGTDLVGLAKAKDANEAEGLLLLALNKYQEAVNIKYDYHQAYNNWGNALGNLAKIKSGQEADDLYILAFDKYQKAIEIKPDKHEVYFNWGNYLGNFAQTKTGHEADKLYSLAFENYQKAIQIKPDKHEAYFNWGTDLMQLAQSKGYDQSEEIFDQALEKLNKAIEYGGNPYNLACLHALRNQKEPALHHLQTSLENKHIQADFVLQDEDWALYFQDPDFLALLQRYPS